MRELPCFMEFNKCQGTGLESHVIRKDCPVGSDYYELLNGTLRFDPAQRVTAAQALKSSFFVNEPVVTSWENLSGPVGEASDEEGGNSSRDSSWGSSPVSGGEESQAPSAAVCGRSLF
mmetsp:Transcript_2110/g.3137  ORF Transcript_2110/g.3137 Transcript_2110/m.3137 type:complete len:118 (+) Transcript_2110:194-547(+)